MLLYIFFILISIFTNSLIIILNNMYDKWYLILIMTLLIPVTFLLYLGIYVILLSIISIFMPKKNKNNKISKICNYLIKETSYIVLKLLRCKIHINTNNIELPDEKILIIANHRSNLDPLILTYFIKKFPIISVSKPENFDAFIYGKYVTNAGYIPIVREDDLKAIEAIKKATKIIQDDKANVIIFPEGKRNHDKELLDFHAGSFKIALRSKCPLLLISLSNTDKKYNIFKRKHIYIDFVKLYNKDDYLNNNTQKLSIEAHDLIKNKYDERNK